MDGMGRTTLAGEAAQWWTRTGLFPDGACFLSFVQFANADRVIQVLGEYLDGPSFTSRSEADQRRRAKELFQTKRVLMVWDNFESVLPHFQPASYPSDSSHPSYSTYSPEELQRLHDFFTEWTGGDGECHGRLLITCRPAETGLTGARATELHGLARRTVSGCSCACWRRPEWTRKRRNSPASV